MGLYVVSVNFITFCCSWSVIMIWQKYCCKYQACQVSWCCNIWLGGAIGGPLQCLYTCIMLWNNISIWFNINTFSKILRSKWSIFCTCLIRCCCWYDVSWNTGNVTCNCKVIESNKKVVYVIMNNEYVVCHSVCGVELGYFMSPYCFLCKPRCKK